MGLSARVTRQAVEVLALDGVGIHPMRVTRQAVEVLALDGVGIHPMRVTRQAVEVLALDGVGIHPMRVTRQAVEVLALAPPQITTLPEPTVGTILLRPDWDVPPELETTWQTDVVETQAGGEERRALADRAFRELRYQFVALRRAILGPLLGSLARRGHSRSLLPLYQDQAFITSSVAPGNTEIQCDTDSRRFFPGGQALIHTWTDGLPSDAEVVEIARVEPDRLVLAAPIAGTFPLRSVVYPLVRVELELEQMGDLRGDETVVVKLRAREVSGTSALPATTADAAGWPVYDDRPVLDLSADWGARIDIGISRAGQRYHQGRAEVVETRGTRPRWRFSLPFLALTRAAALALIRLHEARMGRLRPWWLVGPHGAWEPLAVAADWVSVRPAGNIEDIQDFIDHVALVLRNGSILIRAISSVVLIGGAWKISFDAVIDPPAISKVRRVTGAHLVRFESDSLVERWITDKTCEIRFEAIEVLEESSQDLPDAVSTPSYGPPAAGLYVWTDPMVHTSYSDPIAILPEDQVRTGRSDTEDPDDTDRIDVLDDVRSLPSLPYLAASIAPGTARLVRPSIATWFSGRAWAEHRAAALSGWYLQDGGNPPFWDPALGLTIFAVFYGQSAIADIGERIFERTNCLQITMTRARFYAVAGEDVNHHVNYASLATDNQHFFALVWSPGVYARAYDQGGGFIGEAFAAAPDLAAGSIGSTSTKVLHLRGTNAAAQLVPGVNPFSGTFMIWKRALSTAELNQVGTYLTGLYGRAWETIP